MGSSIIKNRFLVLLALPGLTLAACSGGEQPEPVAPYANYQPSDATSADDELASQTTPPRTTPDGAASTKPDFLADPRSQDNVLADATLDETDVPQSAAPADDDPLADLLGETSPRAPAAQAPTEQAPTGQSPAAQPNTWQPTGDRYAQQPQPAAPQAGQERSATPLEDDDLFADDPQPGAGAAPAGEAAVTGDPFDEARPDAPAPLAGEPQPPAANVLDELFGEEDDALKQPAMPQGNQPQEADPAVAMTQFISAMQAGNLDAANEQILVPSAPARQELVRKQVAKMAEQLIEGTLQFELVQTRVDGDWALAVAHLTVSQNGRTSERISEQYMVLHEGQWKVVPETIRDDPAVQPLIGQSYYTLRTWYGQQRPEFERRHLQTLTGRRP